MNDDSHHVLIALHQDYVKKIPGRIALLETHWKSISEAPFDEQTWRNYYREVHDLCGSSGTHGYNELYKSLRQLNTLLSQALNNGLVKEALAQAPAILTDIQLHATIPPNTPDMFK